MFINEFSNTSDIFPSQIFGFLSGIILLLSEESPVVFTLIFADGKSCLCPLENYLICNYKVYFHLVGISKAVIFFHH